MDYKWIDNFKNNNYDFFYKDKVESVKLYIFYINKNKVLDLVNKEILILDNCKISSNVFISLIKQKNKINGKKYHLDSVFKYNININEKKVSEFLNYNINNDTYLKKINYNNDIFFEDTITILQDMNNLILFFIEKNNNKNLKMNKTKKIKLN